MNVLEQFVSFLLRFANVFLPGSVILTGVGIKMDLESIMQLRQRAICIAAAFFSLAGHAFAQDEPMPILFTNVNVWDGRSEQLQQNANVVVTGNLITAVSTEPLAVANARVIDGGGRTLMPGLIESHVHLN